MKRKRYELWVGIFVVIGILLLAFMTLKIERFEIRKKAGYLVSAYFDTVAGLDRDAPVRVAGVHVGNVERVGLDQGKAKVTFRIPHQIVLYKDSKAYLKSEGFLGEKYIEIVPGTPSSGKVEEGGMIEQGASPADVEQFLTNMSAIRDDVKEIVKPLSEILKAVDTKRVESVIQNIDKFSGKLPSIATDSKEALQKAKEAFARIEEIGEKVKKGEGALGKFISDETIYQDARGAIEKVKETAETLKNVSEKVENGEGSLGIQMEAHSRSQVAKETIQTVKGIAEKVEKGEGTLGKLVSDDALMKETEKTLKKVQKAAEGIQEQTPITVLGTILGIFF